MFDYINSLLSHPKEMLMLLLIALPGRLMAISLHELSHAWMANRCGDPTARMLGRITLNPLRHLDPVGTVMMLVFGFGWAKPVPVNPRNYRNYRRDDLLVSIAGVSMNFIMFLVSCVLMYAILGVALAQAAGNDMLDPVYLENYLGQPSVIYQIAGEYYYFNIRHVLVYGQELITPLWGEIAGYAYQMLMYFSLTNLVLFIFNLIPVPPLDGFHVLNDLVLRKTNVFASPRATQISTGIMFALMFTGAIGSVIGFLQDAMLSGAGGLALRVYSLLGIL